MLDAIADSICKVEDGQDASIAYSVEVNQFGPRCLSIDNYKVLVHTQSPYGGRILADLEVPRGWSRCLAHDLKAGRFLTFCSREIPTL